MALILPAKRETWTEHFTDNSWDDPQDQIDAGYPFYIQPAAADANYIQVVDTGALVTQNALISIGYIVTPIAGTVDLVCNISVSTDGLAWTDFLDTQTAFTKNFRYIKVELEATPADDTSIIRLSPIRVRVNIKARFDGGEGYANSIDASGAANDADRGTQVFFNIDFVDVESITVTPAFNSAIPKLLGFYNLQEPVSGHPTYFRVILVDANTGNYVSGAFSWQAKGV